MAVSQTQITDLPTLSYTTTSKIPTLSYTLSLKKVPLSGYYREYPPPPRFVPRGRKPCGKKREQAAWLCEKGDKLISYLPIQGNQKTNTRPKKCEEEKKLVKYN